jgi:Nucleotidyl transferase
MHRSIVERVGNSSADRAGEQSVANPIRPLILCGEAGTRLWPLSRDSLPKQFALK